MPKFSTVSDAKKQKKKSLTAASTFDYFRFIILFMLFVFAIWFILWTQDNYQGNFVDTLDDGAETPTEDNNQTNESEAEPEVIEIDGIEELPIL